MQFLGELSALLTAMLWTGSAMVFGAATTRMGSMELNIGRLLLALVYLGLTILVLGRDVLILTTAMVILVSGGYRQFPPSIYGKITTLVQILLVFTVLAAAVSPVAALEATKQLLIYLVAGFTVFSGFHYSVVVARHLSPDHTRGES